MSEAITSRLAAFNPFSKSKSGEDDAGENIEPDSVGGGGHGSRQSEITKHQLRVSHALKSFLLKEKVLSKSDVESAQPTGALRELLHMPHINVPASVTDRSHPLSEYFISSSHNTYLTAHQLYGESSAVAYQIALNAGSRCVEIDAWDDSDRPDEPKVTHGYTLASNISFREVCVTIRDVVDKEAAEPANESGYKAAPVMLSLENHCGDHGQLRLVEIMKEVWGDRLLSKEVREEGRREEEGGTKHVTLAELGSKIAVIVEYHFPGEPSDDEEGDSPDEDEPTKEDRKAYEQAKKEAPHSGIIPALADLGVYAQSVKPRDQTWLSGDLESGPHHHLINVSESGLGALMPAESAKIARHNARHLMRVYPKGTRIFSRNLNPAAFWAVGAQIAALNWQTFDASMQLNEALFAGTDGYVLKPPQLRASGTGVLDSGRHRRLRLHVAGASDVPLPSGREADEIAPYVTCTLVHPDDLANDPPKRKTAPYKQHKIGFLHKGENPPPVDPVWDEVLEWEFEANEMVFLRVLVKSDDRFARNPVFAVASVRLSYVVEGQWVFLRMLDLKGRETHCSLLVRFEVEDAGGEGWVEGLRK